MQRGRKQYILEILKIDLGDTEIDTANIEEREKLANWEDLMLVFWDPSSLSFGNFSKDAQYSFRHLLMDSIFFAASPC